MNSKYFKANNNSYSASGFLAFLIGSWPLLQNIWVNLKISLPFRGVLSSIAILGAITCLILLSSTFIEGTLFFVWLPFYCVIILQIISRKADRFEAFKDLLVYLFAALSCMSLAASLANKKTIIKTVAIGGIAVAISVILDQSFGIFKERLISIYTSGSRLFKLKAQTTGGIFPNAGAAAGFVVFGLMAYIAILKSQKKIRLYDWGIIILYITSLIMLKKRGFVLSGFVAIVIVVFFKLLHRRSQLILEIDIQKVVKIAFVIIAAIGLCVVLYSRTEFFKDIADDFIEKFSNEDSTFSGRTTLYEIALRLFHTSPLTGIGWGRYRAHTLGVGLDSLVATYDTHNVYLQVLCETGITGFSVYVIALITVLVTSFRTYSQTIIKGADSYEKISCEFGLELILFFVLYSMSGNPLYDYAFISTFFIGIFLTRGIN